MLKHALLKAFAATRGYRKIWAHCGGGMGVMLAASALPLAALGLGAVEFSRVMMVRGQLQGALDAATIAVARSPLTDAAQQDAYGTSVLQQSLAIGGDIPTWGPIDFNKTSGVVTGTATLSTKPIIAQMLFPTGIQIFAESEVKLLGRKIEVALAIDNSDSMEWDRSTDPDTPVTKLTRAKTAARSFVTKLSSAAASTGVPDALKISLIPFNSTVNTGMTNTSDPNVQNWINANMDVSARSSIHDDIFFGASPNRFTLLRNMNRTWKGCVEARPMGPATAPLDYDVTDVAPAAAAPDSLFVPYFAPDEPDNWPTDRSNNSYLPDGVASTATFGQRMSNTSKYTSQAFTFSGVMLHQQEAGPDYECRIQPIMRLTTDFTGLDARIQNLTTAGFTNAAMGLMWAWHTLSPNAPFADGTEYGRSDTQKIVVLLTDGENSIWTNSNPHTKSVFQGIGYLINGLERVGITDGDTAQRRAALDSRMTKVCNNMKARGIIIYVVRIGTSAGSALPGCASGEDRYLTVSNADALDDAFDKIADSIVNLRISR